MTKQTRKRSGKHALTVIKRFITKEDLRALLALTILIGGLAVIALAITQPNDKITAVTVPSVSALITMVLQWYFQQKERES